MDLVGHDILNNNQAVLGYLELILQNPTIPGQVKRYAEKASTHARESTLLVEGIKTVLGSRAVRERTLESVDLVSAVERAENTASKMFPSRRMRFENDFSVASAPVRGGEIIESLLVNVIIEAAKQDRADDSTVAVKVRDAEPPDEDSWDVRLEVRNASLPSSVRGEGIEPAYSEDKSKAVRLVGMLFATMVATNLGARFEAHDMTQRGEVRGIAYDLIFKKAGGKK
jgi:hypothetical protein